MDVDQLNRAILNHLQDIGDEASESISKDVVVGDASSHCISSSLGGWVEAAPTASGEASSENLDPEESIRNGQLQEGFLGACISSSLGAASSAEASSVTLKTYSKIKKEKVNYQDKLRNMIAANPKMEDFEKLQEEYEELQKKIRVKEKEFEGHKDKVMEMIDNQGKAMTSCINVITQTEDEKAQNVKEIEKLERDLEAHIRNIKEKQVELDGKCRHCDTQIEKMERKRKRLEEDMEREMSKMEAKESDITKDIERLNEALRSNIKATEDRARMIGGGGTNRVMEFLSKSIKEKEGDLECPVCLETAEVPIYTCQEMHLICSICQPQLRECPECRVPYQAQPRRHRFAEKTASELKKLREEYAQLSTSKI